jgi:hypothetical protein
MEGFIAYAVQRAVADRWQADRQRGQLLPADGAGDVLDADGLKG